MSPRPLSDFPTIRDAAERLRELVDHGHGDLPVQVLVVPDSTLQALQHAVAPAAAGPALMIEYPGQDGRMGFSLVSTERLGPAQEVGDRLARSPGGRRRRASPGGDR